MTLKISAAVSMLAILLDGCVCARFSNVLVRRGSEVPFEYVNYGGPVAFAPQLAQISGPIESVVSLQNALNPCAAPCINSLPLAPVPAAANAQIVAYQAPVANVPVVLGKDDSFGYQYAYAVYDEGTGDKKTQSEQSDGSLVQGQYSFIQPDGFRREVVYTADDLKGFNAIVKTISPEPEIVKTEVPVEGVEIKAAPCELPKNQQINEAPQTERATESIEVATDAVEQVKPSTEKAVEETAATTTEATAVADPSTNVVSYSDIINCLQSKRIANAQAISPLTYILVPAALQRPC